MTRGNDTTTKVFYQGKADDFVIFVDDVPAAQKWRNDHSIPLAQVVSGWKVFVTHKVPESALQPQEVVPKTLEGWETDVEEIGVVTAQSQ